MQPSTSQIKRAGYKLGTAKERCKLCADYQPNELTPQIGKCRILPTLFSKKKESGKEEVLDSLDVECGYVCREFRKANDE